MKGGVRCHALQRPSENRVSAHGPGAVAGVWTVACVLERPTLAGPRLLEEATVVATS